MNCLLVNFLLARISSDNRAMQNQSIMFERTSKHCMLYLVSEQKVHHLFSEKTHRTFVWATLNAYTASMRWHNAAGYQIHVITVG